MVCQIELAPERPRGNSLIEIRVFPLLLLMAFDGQNILLHRDGDFVGIESRHSESHRIGVFTGALDILGRIVGFPGKAPGFVFHEIEQLVEANRGFPEWREIIDFHGHILL